MAFFCVCLVYGLWFVKVGSIHLHVARFIGVRDGVHTGVRLYSS